MKHLDKKLIILLLAISLTACSLTGSAGYASDAPVKTLVTTLETPLPPDAFYRSTPIEKVIISSRSQYGRSQFSANDATSGKQLWRTEYEAFYVGQTEKNILLYDGKNVVWVNPASGEITRKVSHIPSPLKTSFDLNTYVTDGMAFTDEAYITTKALYTQIRSDEKTVDESFQIGITANSWEKNDKLWFVPPVKQIVGIEYKPVVFGDKVLIVNPPQSVDGNQTYQIVLLKTGEEIRRAETPGKYFLIGKNYLIELTGSKIARLTPAENKPLWSIDNDRIIGTYISAIGSQIAIAKPNKDGSRTVSIVEAESGKELKKFDLPNLNETGFYGAFLMKDGTVAIELLITGSTSNVFGYFIGWDASDKKALWRTEFESKNAASLLNIVGDKVKAEKTN